MKDDIYLKTKLVSILQNKTYILLLIIALLFGSQPIFASSNNQQQETSISGVITDETGSPIPGASIIVEGTTIGTISDIEGNYKLNIPANGKAIIVSFLGMKKQTVTLTGQSIINISLQSDSEGIDEVVVVGYGVQKKSHLTAAVSQVGSEMLENRSTGNAAQSLQGAAPGLVISNSASGGEPGGSPDINIRGFVTSGGEGSVGDASPLVLVDGIQMDLNNVNPEDIESVSVLKDAAAASIYGAQAAAGAIIVTTKSGTDTDGKVRVSYSNNFAWSQPTQWPESASAINFAYAIDDARINNGQSPYHDDTEYGYIISNMANPGSAPTIESNSTGTDWASGTLGIEGTGATNWEDVIMKDWAARQKHNLSVSGGNSNLNFFISAGAYDEDGLLEVGDESFQRYNLDAKISAKAYKWLTIELATKLLQSNSDFPVDGTGTASSSKSKVFDLISKLKPTMPIVDPIYGSNMLGDTYYPFWDNQRYQTDNDQMVVQPKFIVDIYKDLKFTAQLNYKRTNNLQKYFILSSQEIMPNGFVDKVTQESSYYSSTGIRNEYFSPNLYFDYLKTVGNHNFGATVGYQSELNEYYSLGGVTNYLITNDIISMNASLDDDQLVSESITHWATQSVFSRFRYNYKEKYLFEFSYRRDGSSRFSPDDRWAGFPSYSAGYNVAKENFWPIEAISTFKLRGSYGTLGNQNVSNYLYLSNIDLATTTYLFDGGIENRALTPDLTSENLTWETVKTTDLGFDIYAFQNKLDVAFSWYRTDIEGMAGQGLDLPAQLGTSAPLTNIGTSRVQGWEIEASWKQQFGDFGYNIRAVLSDYKRTMVEYPNETNSLSQTYYNGQDLGEIWGLQWDGWFMTDDEYSNGYPIDQSFVYGTFEAGDTKYKDINNDGVIDRGEWTKDDSGDFSVIGNTTPRYQFSFNLGLNYKNFDFDAYIQGVGKRDVLLSNHIRFRGPAQGPFHANVWEEHLDYFRADDTTSPLGPNTDAYFPAPYLANPGRNNRNYKYNVDRYIQNGAYVRLKSIQLGYTIPKHITERVKIDRFRVYVSGENLLTASDLLFFDPEVVTSGVTGSAQSYPLSKMISVGLNVSF